MYNFILIEFSYSNMLIHRSSIAKISKFIFSGKIQDLIYFNINFEIMKYIIDIYTSNILIIYRNMRLTI